MFAQPLELLFAVYGFIRGEQAAFDVGQVFKGDRLLCPFAPGVKTIDLVTRNAKQPCGKGPRPPVFKPPQRLYNAQEHIRDNVLGVLFASDSAGDIGEHTRVIVPVKRPEGVRLVYRLLYEQALLIWNHMMSNHFDHTYRPGSILLNRRMGRLLQRILKIGEK